MSETQNTLADIFTDPGSMDLLCVRIAGGETLTDICKVWDVPFATVHNWLNSDEERRMRYQVARAVRNENHAEQLIGELLRGARFDIRTLLDSNGELLPVAAWPDDAARAISSIELEDATEFRGQRRKVRMVSKERFIELLGKYLKMFVDRVEHSGTVSLADALGKARKRASG